MWNSKMIKTPRLVNKFICSPVVWLVLLLLFAIYFLTKIQNIRQEIKEVSQNSEVRPKTILYWNKYFFRSGFEFGFGREPFVNKCRINNCFATENRTYQSLDKFDAVLFHGPLFRPKNVSELPSIRSPSQYYAVLNHECPIKFPHYGFPDLFNITITYRLDSDIFVPYFRFYDSQDRYVAPKLIPNWVKPIHDTNYLKQFMDLYERKSKPVAWLSSNTWAFHNKRTEYINELQKYLSVDIYGKCGKLSCPMEGDMSCYNLFKNDYFFYLSFENNNCVDYVTEKVYKALKNELIPIVMNGADMNRMAPPYSYIDARKYEPKELAEYLKFLMANPMEYLKYHWWRKTYYVTGYWTSHRFEDPLCSLCEFLNSPETELRQRSSYANYHEWYHGSTGNGMCTIQVLKDSDYIPRIDPDTDFYVDHHANGVTLI